MNPRRSLYLVKTEGPAPQPAQPAPVAGMRPEDARLLRDWSRELRLAGLRPGTIDTYASSVRLFLRYLAREEGPGVRQTEREGVLCWLDSLQAGRRGVTLKNHQQSLHQFFRWLAERELIESDPMARLKAPRVDQQGKQPLSGAEMTAVMAYLEKGRKWRDRAFIAVLYDSGMRVTEVCELEQSWLDEDSGHILIPANVAKGRRARTVRLGPTALSCLAQYARVRGDDRYPYLFINLRGGGQVSRESAYNMVRAHFARVGVRGPVGPHRLRHSWASSLSLAGVPVDSLMVLGGWTSQAMPQRYTAQVRQAIALQAHALHSPLDALELRPRRRGRPRTSAWS